MKLTKFGMYATAAALVCSTAATPAFAGRKTTNTLIGVGVGALAGAMLSDGDPWATLGGAAAGGFVGNVATHDHHRGERNYRDMRGEHSNDRQWSDSRR